MAGGLIIQAQVNLNAPSTIANRLGANIKSRSARFLTLSTTSGEFECIVSHIQNGNSIKVNIHVDSSVEHPRPNEEGRGVNDQADRE